MTDQSNLTEPIMTPWEVKGKVNYMAQITQFGTSPIDGDLIRRWERVTRMKIHRFIRRGLVFSHQDIEKLLDCVEKGVPVYLYTGRGPSSESMHMGHLVPFKLTKYLQDALNCIVVVQMSDDEKFFFKDGTNSLDLDRYRKSSYLNARDIIACGFDKNKTLIFSNLESNGGDLYFNNVLLMKGTTMNSVKATYGLGECLPENVLKIIKEQLDIEQAKEQPDQNVIADYRATLKKFSSESNTLGQCVWPAFQCGPAFCTSFRKIFVRSLKEELKTKGSELPEYVAKSHKQALRELTTLGCKQSMMCLVPMAIDQAPYFRMARDLATTLDCPKPAVIHSEFLPGLKQSHGKMSTTGGNSENSTLFLNMNPKDVAQTIKRHAFSGGRDTLEEHREFGGDIRTDISYQYLTFFLESDDQLKEIAEKYTSGEMTSGQIKEMTANLVAEEIHNHQKEVAKVDQTVLTEFFNWDRTLDIGGCHDRRPLDCETSDAEQGINFDRTFGLKCKSK